MVSSELCITRAFRDLSSLLLLDPQLLWSHSLLQLTKGETKENVKDCTWGFVGLVPGSCTYYFHHHSTGQNPIIRSHLFAREAGICSLPMCLGGKWNGFTFATYTYKWSFFVSLLLSVVRSQIKQNLVYRQVLPLTSYMALGHLHKLLESHFLLCLNWIEYSWKLSNMNYMKNIAEFLV